MARTPWSDLPSITEEQVAHPPASLAQEADHSTWARELAATNAAALEKLGMWKSVGTCEVCGKQETLLHNLEPTDEESPQACAECVRRAARPRDRVQLCDNDPSHGPAWRNPHTRRNEYFCGNCHAQTEEGVVQNRWARANDSVDVRQSLPLGVREKPLCEAKDVVGVTPCHGQVKPRGTAGVLLCDQHAGKLRR